MKIKKYLLNIISIILLLLIMVALIIVLTKVKAETNLNTNINDGDKNNVKPSFEYVSAKKSNLSNINFENNFGGSGSDTICQVFSLNNHIVIGKTTSNNYYFEKKSGTLFVAIIDFYGNFKNVVVANEADFTFVNAIMFNNSIYILINNLGYKVYEFNIIKQTLSLVCEGSETGIEITASSTPILICSSNQKSFALNLSTNKKFEFDSIISNVVNISPFGDDLLIIFNSGFSFKIAHLTTTTANTIKNFENCNVVDYNINKTNYVFLIKTKTQTEFLILDKSFNVCGDVVTHACDKSNIYNFGTYNTLLYLNNNQLNSLEFCSHGDELLTNNVCNNVISYFSILLNDEIIVFAETETQLNIYKIYNHNTIELIDTLQNVNSLDIVSVNYINSNLTILGNVNQINSVITNCFGDNDLFVFEFAL